jgi:hypothetical protein
MSSCVKEVKKLPIEIQKLIHECLVELYDVAIECRTCQKVCLFFDRYGQLKQLHTYYLFDEAVPSLDCSTPFAHPRSPNYHCLICADLAQN